MKENKKDFRIFKNDGYGFVASSFVVLHGNKCAVSDFTRNVTEMSVYFNYIETWLMCHVMDFRKRYSFYSKLTEI